MMRKEYEVEARQAVNTVLRYIGEDLEREGLVGTPGRVLRAWEELFAGYDLEPKHAVTTFANPSGTGDGGLVLLKDIEFYSMCEHHMLPFLGKAHIGYIAKDRVIGVSKLARILDIYARRLQIQERLGQQVADFLMEELQPAGVGVVLEAEHLCMRMRGVGKQNSMMVTSCLRGVFLENSDLGIAARNEFMGLIR